MARNKHLSTGETFNSAKRSNLCGMVSARTPLVAFELSEHLRRSQPTDHGCRLGQYEPPRQRSIFWRRTIANSAGLCAGCLKGDRRGGLGCWYGKWARL
jgi:hypothetical protein